MGLDVKCGCRLKSKNRSYDTTPPGKVSGILERLEFVMGNLYTKEKRDCLTVNPFGIFLNGFEKSVAMPKERFMWFWITQHIIIHDFTNNGANCARRILLCYSFLHTVPT
jgi:hypothetical protein